MNINFFTPVNFDDYQAETRLERAANFVGSKLDELFYLGGKKFTVLTKLANRRFEGHIEQRYSLPKLLLIAAIKIACWALPIIAAFSLSQTAGLAAVGVGLTLFAAKCTYRFLHTFVQTELTQDEAIGAIFRQYGRAAYQDPDVMLNFLKMIIETDKEQKHTKLVFNLYQYHANRGHPESLYWLGLCHLEGFGCTPNREKALELLQEAAENDCGIAKQKLDELKKSKAKPAPLERSVSKSLTPQEAKQVKENLEGSVRSKHPKLLNPEQREIRKKIDNAYARWADIVESAESMHKLAELIKNIDKYKDYQKDLFFLYQMHAEKEKDGKSMICFGQCYAEGIGCEPNSEEASKWYQAGFRWCLMDAENGNAKSVPSMFLLAECYEKGTGCEPNQAEAIKWYRAAARRRWIPAIKKLQGLEIAEEKPVSGKKRAVSAEDAQTMIRRK